jgi:hypothetical protein
MKTTEMLDLLVAALAELPGSTPCLGQISAPRTYCRASKSRTDAIAAGELVVWGGAWGILSDGKKSQEFREDGAVWVITATAAPAKTAKDRMRIGRAMYSRWCEQTQFIALLDDDMPHMMEARFAQRALRRDIMSRCDAAISAAQSATDAFYAAKAIAQ